MSSVYFAGKNSRVDTLSWIGNADSETLSTANFSLGRIPEIWVSRRG